MAHCAANIDLVTTISAIMNQPTDNAPQPLPELDATRLCAVVEHVLARARAAGADAVECNVSAGRALSVAVRQGEVETLEFHADNHVGIDVIFAGRCAAASTADLATGSVDDAVDAACAIARHTGVDEYAGLAPAERMAQTFPDLDLYHPWALTPEQAMDLARECEAAGLAADHRISNSEGAQVGTHAGLSVYGNSHGFVGTRRSSSHSLSCSLIAGTGSTMQRDYWYDTACNASQLEAAAGIGQRAAQRVVSRLEPGSIPTGSYPVLFPPQLARGLLGGLLQAVSGGAQYRRASFLLDAVGQAVASPLLQLRQRPHLRGAAASTAFDGDGVATIDRDLVTDGKLQGYLLSAYSARRLGMETTGNAGGVFNLEVQPGAADLQGLMQQMGRGLLLHELMGSGLNPITGDYSRGAAGYWVENGEIVYPVQGVTIAGNLRDMLMDIQALGNDVDARHNVRAPSVLIGSMTVAAQ